MFDVNLMIIQERYKFELICEEKARILINKFNIIKSTINKKNPRKNSQAQ